MKLETIWLAICVVIAIANVAGAIANYWGVRRNRTMRAIERELSGLKADVDALKKGPAQLVCFREERR